MQEGLNHNPNRAPARRHQEGVAEIEKALAAGWRMDELEAALDAVARDESPAQPASARERILLEWVRALLGRGWNGGEVAAVFEDCRQRLPSPPVQPTVVAPAGETLIPKSTGDLTRRQFLGLAGGSVLGYGLIKGLGPSLSALLAGSSGEIKGLPDWSRDRLVSLDTKGHLRVDFPPYAKDPKACERLLPLSHVSYIVVQRVDPGPEQAFGLLEGYRDQIEQVAKQHQINPRILEGIFFLESGGNRNATSPDGMAVGIGQHWQKTVLERGFVTEAGIARARVLSHHIANLDALIAQTSDTSRVSVQQRLKQKLEHERASADPRFDPYKSMELTAKTLAEEYARYGREDFMIWAYHAGSRNVDDAITTYVSPRRYQSSLQAIQREKLTFREIFQVSPLVHPQTYNLTHHELGDSSRYYTNKVRAAMDLIALHRENPAGCTALLGRFAHPQVSRQTNILEEATIWPEYLGPQFEDVGDIVQAVRRGELVRLPDNPKLYGYQIDHTGIGQWADPKVRQYFQYTRPDTIGMLLLVSSATRQHSRESNHHLVVTSAVRSKAYQQRLYEHGDADNPEWTSHAWGTTIDIDKHFQSERQAQAVLHVLERLVDLNLIRYLDEGNHYHIVVNPQPEVAKYFQQIYQEDLLRTIAQRA